MHTREELRMRQALPLNLKIRLTEERIREWINHYGVDGVYVSFSGGKDSTVLLDIVRRNYPKVPAVFCDTGLEYPEIREFVKTFENVTWLKPKMNFKQVIEKYGYPIISKEISEAVDQSRKYLAKLIDKRNALTDRQTIPYAHHFADLIGIERRKKGVENKDFENLKKGIIPNLPYDDKYENGLPARLLMLYGKLPHKEKWKPTNEYSKRYDKSKWLFLLDAPFEMSSQCCNVMKKGPIKQYAKRTKRVPITAQMASESRLRTQKWLQNGCNGFEMKSPISNPMSFWTEQDVLLYIKQNNLPICSVYGDIVEVIEDENAVAGQMTISDIAGFEDQASFDAERPALKTTGCDRTGCMFCGFWCHLEDPGSGRFERMKKTHPKQYEWIMKPWADGGLGYKEVIDWINEHGGLDIRY